MPALPRTLSALWASVLPWWWRSHLDSVWGVYLQRRYTTSPQNQHVSLFNVLACRCDKNVPTLNTFLKRAQQLSLVSVNTTPEVVVGVIVAGYCLFKLGLETLSTETVKHPFHLALNSCESRMVRTPACLGPHGFSHGLCSLYFLAFSIKLSKNSLEAFSSTLFTSSLW